MCEDYRAGLRADRAHEEADRAAGRKIRCIHSGHHQAEQAPDELASTLLDFLGRPAPRPAAAG